MKLLDCYMPAFIQISDVETNYNRYDSFQNTRDKFTLIIEQAVSRAENLNITDRERDDAFYAVTVLIDEKILCSSLNFRDEWRDNLLQYKYFGNSVGGELFFEKLDGLDGIHSEALSVFLFCLLLGFKGKYIESNQDVIGDYISKLHGIILNEPASSAERNILEKRTRLKHFTLRKAILILLSFYLMTSFALIM
ncbi:TPA: DotU family type IV/VI secretion system protein [Raoultella planticola]